MCQFFQGIEALLSMDRPTTRTAKQRDRGNWRLSESETSGLSLPVPAAFRFSH